MDAPSVEFWAMNPMATVAQTASAISFVSQPRPGEVVVAAPGGGAEVPCPGPGPGVATGDRPVGAPPTGRPREPATASVAPARWLSTAPVIVGLAPVAAAWSARAVPGASAPPPASGDSQPDAAPGTPVANPGLGAAARPPGAAPGRAVAPLPAAWAIAPPTASSGATIGSSVWAASRASLIIASWCARACS